MLDFKGNYGTDVRPARDATARKPWAKNPAGPEASDGTRLDATAVNDLKGMIIDLLTAYGITPSPGDDTLITQAVAAAIALHGSSAAHDSRYYTEAEVDAFLTTLTNAINGLGDVIVVPDLAAAGALTGLDNGDLVHVLDNGSGKWVRYQVTAAGDGTWGGATKVVIWTQDQAPSTHTHPAADISDSTANGRAILTAADYAAMRTLLSLVVGTNVQAYSANLASWSALAPSAKQDTVTAALLAAFAFGPFTDNASAATTDLGAVATIGCRITGTTTITSLGTGANLLRIVKFAGALTLTHNATSLILPSASNIPTAAGDCAIFMSDGSGNWTCTHYQRADGTPLVPAATQIKQILDDVLGTNQSTSTSGTALFTGSEITPVNTASTLLIAFSGVTQLTRAAEAGGGILELQERVDTGGGYGAYATVRQMSTFINPAAAGNTSIDLRHSAACHYSRALTGVVKVQYRLIAASLSTSPAATLQLNANAVIRYQEIKI